jgi:glycine/serine hydroxymethyltransferase
MWLLKHSNKIPPRLESLKNRDSQILEAEKLRVKSQFEFLNMIHSEDFIAKSIYDSMWEVPKSTYMNIE